MFICPDPENSLCGWYICLQAHFTDADRASGCPVTHPHPRTYALRGIAKILTTLSESKARTRSFLLLLYGYTRV